MEAGIPKQLKLSTLIPLVVNSLFLFLSSFCLWTIKATINVHSSKQATTYSLLKLELNKIYYRITTYGCNDQFPNIQFPSSVLSHCETQTELHTVLGLQARYERRMDSADPTQSQFKSGNIFFTPQI